MVDIYRYQCRGRIMWKMRHIPSTCSHTQETLSKLSDRDTAHNQRKDRNMVPGYRYPWRKKLGTPLSDPYDECESIPASSRHSR